MSFPAKIGPISPSLIKLRGDGLVTTALMIGIGGLIGAVFVKESFGLWRVVAAATVAAGVLLLQV